MCEQSSAASADSRAGFPWQLPSSIKHLGTVYAMGRWDKSSNSVQDSCKEGKNSFSIVLPGETRQEAMYFESQADLNPVRSGAGTPEGTPPCPTQARPSAWSSPASSCPTWGSHWTWRWLFPTGVPFPSKGPPAFWEQHPESQRSWPSSALQAQARVRGHSHYCLLLWVPDTVRHSS